MMHAVLATPGILQPNEGSHDVPFHTRDAAMHHVEFDELPTVSETLLTNTTSIEVPWWRVCDYSRAADSGEGFDSHKHID